MKYKPRGGYPAITELNDLVKTWVIGDDYYNDCVCISFYKRQGTALRYPKNNYSGPDASMYEFSSLRHLEHGVTDLLENLSSRGYRLTEMFSDSRFDDMGGSWGRYIVISFKTNNGRFARLRIQVSGFATSMRDKADDVEYSPLPEWDKAMALLQLMLHPPTPVPMPDDYEIPEPDYMWGGR